MTTGAEAGKAHISKDGRTAVVRELSSARRPQADPVTSGNGTMVARPAC